MTPTTTAEKPHPSYRTKDDYPFCPGCGHGSILDSLNASLVQQQIDPTKVVIVSDIGCAGLSDEYFDTSAFHGLHGRCLTYATGIKLARPDLKVVVLMGDGGTGIGGAHLLSAARRNIGLTLLLMNNFNFGMTGGQHSTTTPTGGITATTPAGNPERPLDICGTVAVNGAGFIWRGSNFEKDLPDRITEAMEAECFALLDIWDLCTAYYVPKNKLAKKSLDALIGHLGFETGLIRKEEVPEYAASYQTASEPHHGKPPLKPATIEARYEAKLDRRFRLVVAGSAGAKVRSAVMLCARAGMLCDLWVTQRDDYPITIKTGHSVSELILGPEDVQYTGMASPDALLILSQDGFSKVGRYLDAMTPEQRVFVVPEFKDVKTQAQVTIIDPEQAGSRIGPMAVALFAIAAVLKRLDILPSEALEAAAEAGRAQFVEMNKKTIAAGLALPD